MVVRSNPFALLVGLEVSSCLPSVCSEEARAGLNVTVTDSVTGQPICDATVTAVQGAMSEELMEFAGRPGSSCVYAGAYEEPGDYDIDVTRVGYAPAVISGVVVSTNGCHVDLQVRSVALIPMNP